jgi:hypothetical protein
VAVLLSVAEGKAQHPTFSLWQPFKGGREFVLLQMVGWSFYAFSSLLFFIIGQSAVVPMQNGLVSALGCASLASVLSLFTSVDRFDRKGLDYDIKLVTRPNLVILALGLASIGEAAMLEMHLARFVQWETDLRRVVFATNIASVLTVCGMGYWRVDWTLLQPFHGGFDFILLQGGGWAGVGVATYMSTRLSYGDPPEGATLVTCVLHCISLALLVVSFDVFKPAAVTPSEILSLVMGIPKGVVGCAGVSAVAFVAVCCFDFMGMIRAPIGLLMSCILLAGTPATHILASRNVPNYELWQPFFGGGRFVLLQGIAWTVYAVGGVGTLMSLINDFPTLASATGLFVCISALLICTSTGFVEFSHVHQTQQRAKQGEVVNSEFVTAALVSAAGILLSIAADFSDVYAKRHEMAILAVLICLTAFIGCQFSGTKAYPGVFRFSQPFHGGLDFNVLQAVGWTGASLALPIAGVVVLNILLNPEIVPPGSCVALCALISACHCVIMLSLLVYDPTAVGNTIIVKSTDSALSPCLNYVLPAADLATASKEASILAQEVSSPHLRELLKSMADGKMERRGEYSAGLAVAGGILSVALFINAELFYALVPVETATVPCILFTVIAACLTVFSAVCIHFVTGPRRYRKAYRSWMPMEGGMNFVVMQAVGWFLMVLNVLLAAMILQTLHSGARLLNGSFVLVGAEAVSVSIVLLVSLRYFDVNCLTDTSVYSGFVFRNEGWCVGSIMTLCSIATFAATQGLLANLGPLPSTGILIQLSLANCYLSIPLAWLSVMKARPLRPADEPFSLSVEVIACALLVQLFLWAMSRTDMFLPMAVAACIAGTSHVATLLILLHKEESSIRRRVQAEIAMMVLYGWPMALMILYAATLLCFPSYLVRSLVFLSTCIDTQSIGGKRRRLLSTSLAVLAVVVGSWERDVLSVLLSVAVLLYTVFRVSENAQDVGMRLASWVSDMVAHVRPVVVGSTPYVLTHPDGVYAHIVEPAISTMTLLRIVRMGGWCHPKTTILAHSWMFEWPLLRDILAWVNIMPLTDVTLNAVLVSGRSCVLCPSTARDFEQNQQFTIALRHERQGWLRMCTKFGTTLIPVLVVGEGAPVIPNRWLLLQQWCYAATGLVIPIPCGPRLSTYTPPSRQLHVALGRPCPTACEEWMGIELRHELVWDQYTRTLASLAETTSGPYGPFTLRFV